VVVSYSLTNTPESSIDEIIQNQNNTGPGEDAVVVINLMGSIAGQNEFAVTEEQYLEYSFNIISGVLSFVGLNEYIAARTKYRAFMYFGFKKPC
jgi:hypothetical protein